MNKLTLLPAIVLGAAALFSTSAMADGFFTGVGNAVGSVATGVGNATTHVVGGVVHGTTYVVHGVTRTTTDIFGNRHVKHVKYVKPTYHH